MGHHDNHVRIHNHFQAMTDHDDGESSKLCPDGSMHDPLGIKVDAGAHLVEQQKAPLALTDSYM